MDAKDVHKLAHLARLTIEDDLVDDVTHRITRIMSLVDQLKAVDTTGVEPMSHPLDAVQVLRTDEVTESNQREQWQTVAPAVEDGLYLVPQVID